VAPIIGRCEPAVFVHALPFFVSLFQLSPF
jgi:hypothetical protein